MYAALMDFLDFSLGTTVLGYNPIGKIHKAAKNGNLDQMRLLLYHGSYVNDTDKKDRTPLHYACAYGQPEVVTFLIKMNCNLQLCDSDGNTPLMKAIEHKQEECATILLENGADPNIQNKNGATALHWAVFCRSTSMAEKLLSFNANIDAQSKYEETPLLLALQYNKLQMAEFLIQRKANIHIVDKEERTTLMLAVKHKSKNIVKLLLQGGINISAEDKSKQTALSYAITSGHNAFSNEPGPKDSNDSCSILDEGNSPANTKNVPEEKRELDETFQQHRKEEAKYGIGKQGNKILFNNVALNSQKEDMAESTRHKQDGFFCGINTECYTTTCLPGCIAGPYSATECISDTVPEKFVSPIFDDGYQQAKSRVKEHPRVEPYMTVTIEERQSILHGPEDSQTQVQEGRKRNETEMGAIQNTYEVVGDIYNDRLFYENENAHPQQFSPGENEEQDGCALEEEEEKSKDYDQLYEQFKDQIREKEEECNNQVEVTKQLEISLETLDAKLRTTRNKLNQVSTTEIEEELRHEYCRMREEITVMRLDIDTIKHHKEKEKKYLEDLEVLREKHDDLQRTIKLTEETLTKTTLHYNEQISILKAELEMQKSNLESEEENTETPETEVSSYPVRLAAASPHRDENQTAERDLGFGFQGARNEGFSLQDKEDFDVSNLTVGNKLLPQQLSRSEIEIGSLEHEGRHTVDTLRKVTFDLMQTQGQTEEMEDSDQDEESQGNKNTENQEWIEKRLSQPQSGLTLSQQKLQELHNEVEDEEDVVVIIQDQFHHTVNIFQVWTENPILGQENSNMDLIDKCNQFKEELYQHETMEVERETQVAAPGIAEQLRENNDASVGSQVELRINNLNLNSLNGRLKIKIRLEESEQYYEEESEIQKSAPLGPLTHACTVSVDILHPPPDALGLGHGVKSSSGTGKAEPLQEHPASALGGLVAEPSAPGVPSLLVGHFSGVTQRSPGPGSAPARSRRSQSLLSWRVALVPGLGSPPFPAGRHQQGTKGSGLLSDPGILAATVHRRAWSARPGEAREHRKVVASWGDTGRPLATPGHRRRRLGSARSRSGLRGGRAGERRRLPLGPTCIPVSLFLRSRRSRAACGSAIQRFAPSPRRGLQPASQREPDASPFPDG
ncbi:ankyrin repeat domain-containing protein 20B-like [Sciurus carolinensis]|uniref:ankyrin repeat domain-containing protein 20B-like n=1 Tax=Sciurus carolinensis TaxID=30640 RepID=UPI001FB31759|nr:ankyrin repeat domain-containing protein 20B-like [Sciurus carolinensis]